VFVFGVCADGVCADGVCADADPTIRPRHTTRIATRMT
jgi:hypothetical protein